MSRVVEVASGVGTRGSGYVLTSRLVLTAGHVATPPECRVRGVPDDREWPARMVWSGADQDLDVALLQVDGDDWPVAVTDVPIFGRLITDDVSVPVVAQGFPEF